MNPDTPKIVGDVLGVIAEEAARKIPALTVERVENVGPDIDFCIGHKGFLPGGWFISRAEAEQLFEELARVLEKGK